MNAPLSKSASVWDLDGVRWVLDPENKRILTQGEDGAPLAARFDLLDYEALAGYIIDNGILQ